MEGQTTPRYITQTVRAIFSAAFLWLMVYLLFYDIFTFNYESYINGQYVLVLWMPVVAMLLIYLYQNGPPSNFKLGMGLFLIAFVSGVLCWSYYYSFGNEYFFSIAVMALLCYGIFLLSHILVLRSLVFAFLALFVFQLYLGIQQCKDGKLVSGTLENSGVYAYYLVSHLPFFYWASFYLKNRLYQERGGFLMSIVYWIFLVFIGGTVFYLICATQSRTALTCLLITILYFLFSNYKHKILLVVKIIPNSLLGLAGSIVIGSVVWVSAWLFNLKKMSAIGRLLSLNVAWENITKHFWIGTGLGRFTWYYPQWQANYFSAHPKISLPYFFSADESYIIFNEYLQLFETVGLVGFVLCGYCLYNFFKLQSKIESSLLSASKCTVIAILSSGFTSYPFHVNILLLFLGTCLAIGFALSDEVVVIPKSTKWLYFNKSMTILCFFLVCYAFFKGFSAYQAATQWASLRNTSAIDKLRGYRRIYSTLNNDGKFLTEYGSLLLVDSTQLFTAINTLESAKQLLITRKGIEALAAAYGLAQKYDAAIANQQFLTNYLPNKFKPKYDLLQFYVLRNDTINIQKTGEIILQLPKKIPSAEVERMKENTRNILKRFL